MSNLWDIIKGALHLADDTPEPENAADLVTLFPQPTLTEHPTTRLEEPTPADVDAQEDWDYTTVHWYHQAELGGK